MKKRALLVGVALLLLGAIVVGGLWWRQARRAAYVPKNLDEAHAQLLYMLSPAVLQRIRDMPDEKGMNRLHHGLGRWIRNNWGLWAGGELADSLRKLGLHHPDDMSGVILDTFWCKLHNQPFRLEERVAYYDEFWRSRQEPTEGSPTDGATIAWGIIQGRGKGTVHLGISQSDGSYWRYEYGSQRGIEPARPDECESLKDLAEMWKENKERQAAEDEAEAKP